MIRNKIKQILSCTTYAWLIWFIASLFYSLEYFQRVSPAVMANPLMASFHINAETLGFIISLYFYAYAAAQIPVGLLLDRFGTRKLLTLSCAIISFGTLLFAVAKLLIFLALARLLIGFGSAFAFIGVLKLASQWYASEKFPIMVGLTNTLGVLGATFGEAPLAELVEHYGWSNSLIIISVFGFFVSFLIWIIIQDKPERTCEKILHTPHHTDKPFSVSFALKDIFLCPQTWLTAIYAGLMVTPVIAFAELWAIPFLMQSYHIHSIIAADLNTAIFIGIGVGGPVNGWLVSKLKQPKKIMAGGNIVALLSLITIIYIPNLSYVFGAVLLFIFGFSTSSMLIAFSLNKNRHSNQHSGLVTAFTNMIIMIMGAIYQPVIGKLLDTFLELKTPSVYTLVDFHHALIILPITSAISLLVILMVKIKPQEQINKNLRPLARV